MSIWYWIICGVFIVSVTVTFWNLITLSSTLSRLSDKIRELEKFYGIED